jgi:hypothetical protein
MKDFGMNGEFSNELSQLLDWYRDFYDKNSTNKITQSFEFCAHTLDPYIFN